MRLRDVLIPTTAILLSGCDVLTDPSLTAYRDVWWSSVGIDSVITNDFAYPIELGSYTWTPEGGAEQSCTVSGRIASWGFGWVELASSGRIARVGPSHIQEPYDMIQVSLQSMCDGDTGPVWFMNAHIDVEPFPDKQNGTLEIRSIGFGEVMLNHDWLGASEAERWLEVDLNGGVLRDTMHIPVTLTVRAWHSGIETQLAEWTRTVVLIHVRQEATHERGSP